MKILTVREPWATLIIHGAKTRRGKCETKDIENRVWVPPIALKGQRIAIHAGQSTAGLGSELLYVEEAYGVTLEKADLKFGFVLGSVELATWVADSRSKWFQGPVGFVLKDPFIYPKPIICKGQLKFFEEPTIAKTLARYERLRLKAAEK